MKTQREREGKIERENETAGQQEDHQRAPNCLRQCTVRLSFNAFLLILLMIDIY